MNLLRSVAAAIAFCAAGLLPSTCLPRPDGCTPTSTRCNGQRAEVCDGAARWTLVMDCADVSARSGRTWSCCSFTPDGGSVAEHLCLPAAQCSGGTP